MTLWSNFWRREMENNPVQIIGQFNPKLDDVQGEWYFIAEFEAWLEEHGITVMTGTQARYPDMMVSLFDEVFEWHQDGNSIKQVIMWSNVRPTMIRDLKTHRRIYIKPLDVVLIQDNLVEHRA